MAVYKARKRVFWTRKDTFYAAVPIKILLENANSRLATSRPTRLAIRLADSPLRARLIGQSGLTRKTFFYAASRENYS